MAKFFRNATLNGMAARGKDYWRQKREKEEWFRSVNISYLFQFQTLTKELEQFAKNNPHPTAQRLVNDCKRIFAGMTEQIVDFNLKQERLPEDQNGIFSSAVLSAPNSVK